MTGKVGSFELKPISCKTSGFEAWMAGPTGRTLIGMVRQGSFLIRMNLKSIQKDGRMLRKFLAVSLFLAFCTSAALAAVTSTGDSKLTAGEIATRNAAARGGLEAWRAVTTLSWEGKLGAGGNRKAEVPEPVTKKKAAELPSDPRPKEEVQLQFVMDMQRPNRTRFELQFKGQTAVQVFDGKNGWKLRPYLNRLEVEPYSEDESRMASMQQELDGPLIDYAAKGTGIELDGMEKVEGRDTYKLKLSMKDGQTLHLWIDAQTFLDAKIEGHPRRLDGEEHPVEIYYRDFRAVNGLQFPFVLETRVLPIANPTRRVKAVAVPPEKIVIDKVVVNPKLDASLFSKPEVQVASNKK